MKQKAWLLKITIHYYYAIDKFFSVNEFQKLYKTLLYVCIYINHLYTCTYGMTVDMTNIYFATSCYEKAVNVNVFSLP